MSRHLSDLYVLELPSPHSSDDPTLWSFFFIFFLYSFWFRIQFVCPMPFLLLICIFIPKPNHDHKMWRIDSNSIEFFFIPMTVFGSKCISDILIGELIFLSIIRAEKNHDSRVPRIPELLVLQWRLELECDVKSWMSPIPSIKMQNRTRSLTPWELQRTYFLFINGAAKLEIFEEWNSYFHHFFAKIRGIIFENLKQILLETFWESGTNRSWHNWVDKNSKNFQLRYFINFFNSRYKFSKNSRFECKFSFKKK